MILLVFVQFACYHIMKTIGEYFSSLLNMSIFCRDLEDEKNEKEEKKEKEEAVEKELIHTDESGIKIEVVSVDGTPTNLLVHIPDGRVIDLSCEY